ncbi:Luciferin 4-monooxygenase [Pseudolycoriella hygida]|uniref:Luciferin 4-monooxygenase n=1 Tax=Pseudolycoriella hygida TaxID=35572 RepID=A0A9Q0MZA2_9DIPT|nr:Luciferin 4-monooxygenase [Pseudolycoriella hygida]
MTSDNRISYGGKVNESLDKARSFGEYCYNRLKKLGDSVLFVNGVTSQEVTASQLLSQSIRVAECLKHYGVKRGDSISICCENRVEVAYVMFGIFFVGAKCFPLNPTYTEGELLHASSLSQPKIIFASYQTFDNIKRVAKHQFVEKVLVFGDECTDSNSFNDFLRNPNVESKKRFYCSPQSMMENISLILCSSGTTGLPKGVQWSEYSTWFNASFNMLDPIPNECRFSVSPWTHGFGCFTVIRTVVHGIKLVYLPKFDENTFLSCIEKFNVTTLMVVPPLLVMLSKSSAVKHFNTSSLKYAISAAAPLRSEVLNEMRRQIPNLTVRQYYGMSEGGVFTVQTNEFCKSGSVGILRSGVYAKVVNIESGELLGKNSPGELLFKGPGLMKGYVGDINSTKSTVDKDGWLHSGDVGFYDENNEWFIVDRLKELIKYKGFQVPPAELEALLLSHQSVKDVGVIGIPDDLAGELPMAFVVRQGSVTEKDIVDFVADRSSPAKRLYGGVRFVTEIPKNPSGKILRQVLRQMVNQHKSKM